MATEIERKFKVVGEGWRSSAKRSRIVQGYLSKDRERVVRIRIEDDRAAIAVKGPAHGSARKEYEFEIPVAEARELMQLCLQPIVEKTRHRIPAGPLMWEVDEFHAPRSGLVIAEIELPSEDHSFNRPSWLGEEVTGDASYYNHNLTDHDP